MPLAPIILSAVLVGAPELLDIRGPDGQVAWINTHEISSLRAPIGADLAQHFARGSRCIVVMTNGKFIASVEPCPELRARAQKHE